MKLMLEDTFSNLDYNVELNESTNEKTYVVSGIFSSPGKKNRNGRTYPLNVWEGNVQEYQKEIKSNAITTLMEAEHPPRSTVDQWKAVGKIRKMELRDGLVYGEAQILNNNSPETNQLKALIDAGVPIGVSTRGVGRLGKNNIVEEYKMITVDFVSNPSDYGANLEGFSESMILEEQNYSLEEGNIVCTPAGCKLEEGKNASLADKLLASLPDTKAQREFEKKHGSVYKMSKEELLKHLKMDESQESQCSKNAKVLIETLNEFSKPQHVVTATELKARELFEKSGKMSFKEIQKEIQNLKKEIKQTKKGSDEYDIFTDELKKLEDYLKATGMTEASVKFENAYQDLSKALRIIIAEVKTKDKKAAKQLENIWQDIDNIIDMYDPMDESEKDAE